MSDEKSRDQGRFLVRMSPELRDRIAEVARTQGRSMNAEIVMNLEMMYPPTPPAEELIPIVEGVLRLSDAGKDKRQWNQLHSLLYELRARLEAEVAAKEAKVPKGRRLDLNPSPYEMGMKAFHSGATNPKNPFPAGSENADRWDQGFVQEYSNSTAREDD